MTGPRHRRTARAFTLGAGGALAAGLAAAALSPWLLAPALYIALFLAWCARSYYAAHRRQVAEADWERRRVLGEWPDPLNPCCMLARDSEGAVHDRRRCTDMFRRITADFADNHRSSR